jgi:hypothetical protein
MLTFNGFSASGGNNRTIGSWMRKRNLQFQNLDASRYILRSSPDAFG